MRKLTWPENPAADTGGTQTMQPQSYRHVTGKNRLQRRGFTLVEVLVTVTILSVGMLGIASLYSHSLQAGRTSMLRHNAVTLAGDIADRIRANPRAGAAYMLGGENNSCVDAGIDCTPPQMARHDVLLWNKQAAATLPNGAVTIVFDGASLLPGYQIKVAWTEPGRVLNYSIAIVVLAI
jgi:type IV pilus assembly protein PilV